MIRVEADSSEDWDSRTDWAELARSAVQSAVACSRHRALAESGITVEVSVKFAGDDEVRSLNAGFRGKDKPTNVLSFPQAFGPLLGDVILAAGTVRDEAALARKPLKDHMAHLIVHGFLHVIGYDHEADEEAEAMEAVEREALKRMGIADPYAPARDR